MAFQTGSSTSIDNLMAILSTFAQANGWIEDDVTPGVTGSMSLHKNSIYVHFQWDEAADGVGHMAIYQSLGYINIGTSKWLHTDDSGNGKAGTSGNFYDDERCVNGFAGPHVNYWFFENNASPAYIHIVVEVSAGIYRHFGFGELNKTGDWAGGEYCYGHHWALTGSTAHTPDSSHSAGIDFFVSGNKPRSATIHIEGHTGEPNVNTKWAMMSGYNGAAATNDRAGVVRWNGMGGARGGPFVNSFGHVPFARLNAFKPLLPIAAFVRDLAPAPDAAYLLGFQPDKAVVNIANLDPASTVTVGGDTWYIFPWVRKQHLLASTQESWNAGWAYRQIVA